MSKAAQTPQCIEFGDIADDAPAGVRRCRSSDTFPRPGPEPAAFSAAIEGFATTLNRCYSSLRAQKLRHRPTRT